ncbi:MAG: hypothetical protein AABX82_08615, partial [Nanoarchaeota archaeon]
PKVKKLILEQLEKIKTVCSSDVLEAQTYIEGSLALRRENTAAVAEELAYWHHAASIDAFDGYLERVKKVTAADVHRVAKKYFTDRYTFAVLEQK